MLAKRTLGGQSSAGMGIRVRDNKVPSCQLSLVRGRLWLLLLMILRLRLRL